MLNVNDEALRNMPKKYMSLFRLIRTDYDLEKLRVKVHNLYNANGYHGGMSMTYNDSYFANSLKADYMVPATIVLKDFIAWIDEHLVVTSKDDCPVDEEEVEYPVQPRKEVDKVSVTETEFYNLPMFKTKLITKNLDVTTVPGGHIYTVHITAARAGEFSQDKQVNSVFVPMKRSGH